MLTRQVEITNDELVKALSTRCDAAAGSLMMLCGIMGTGKAHLGEFSIKELADEVKERGIDLTDVTTSIHGDPLLTTPPYLLAIGAIERPEYNRWWSRVKATGNTDYTPEVVAAWEKSERERILALRKPAALTSGERSPT